MEYKLSLSKLRNYAAGRGIKLIDPQGLIGQYFYLAGCLPISEQDELQARFTSGELKTEDDEREACWNYFDHWNDDYVRGFCSSIRDRVLVGCYLSLYGLDDCDIVE